MVVVDGAGVPLGSQLASASPAEVTLAEGTLKKISVPQPRGRPRNRPLRVIADRGSMAMPIRANHVYVIPPDADLLIEDYTFKVVSPRSKRNVQVDLFLTSLAAAMGARAIGIILSGLDGDGAEGCKQIKAKGGTTFAQDISAEVGNMPLHAQASGCVDFVLSPADMPGELQRLASTYKKRSDDAH